MNTFCDGLRQDITAEIPSDGLGQGESIPYRGSKSPLLWTARFVVPASLL